MVPMGPQMYGHILIPKIDVRSKNIKSQSPENGRKNVAQHANNWQVGPEVPMGPMGPTGNFAEILGSVPQSTSHSQVVTNSTCKNLPA